MQAIRISLSLPLKDFAELLETLSTRVRKQLFEAVSTAGITFYNETGKPITRLGKRITITKATKKSLAKPDDDTGTVAKESPAPIPLLRSIPSAQEKLFEVAPN